MGPYDSGSNLGTHEYTYMIDEGNYSLGDVVEYYLKFQQYEVNGKFLQVFYYLNIKSILELFF